MSASSSSSRSDVSQTEHGVDTDHTVHSNSHKGRSEVEISYSTDLYKHKKNCEKNPDRKKFIPVNNFDANHPPADYNDYNDECLADLVKTMSDLTVRVSVKYISEARPKTWPGSNILYPFSSDSFRERMRVGTGWVMEVLKDDGLCLCPECHTSSSPKRQYAAILIRTAAHLVYDELEGRHTTCHLFFDRSDTPDRCNDIVTLSGMSCVDSNIECDYCDMKYDTHDIDLADRIEKTVKTYKNLQKKLRFSYEKESLFGQDSLPDSEKQLKTVKTYKNLQEKLRFSYERESSIGQDSSLDSKKQLVVVVSHPHGCSKQVSVGYYTSRKEDEDSHSRLTYTTPTCPGSSGAPVFLLGKGTWRQEHVHGGKLDKSTELKYTGCRWDTTVPSGPGDELQQQQQHKC